MWLISPKVVQEREQKICYNARHILLSSVQELYADIKDYDSVCFQIARSGANVSEHCSSYQSQTEYIHFVSKNVWIHVTKIYL